MRNLKTSDLFTLSRIIKKMNIKDEIKHITQNVTSDSAEKKGKADQNIEVDLAMLFIENIGAAEKEIYKFFADLTSKTSSDIENMELSKFIDLVKELFSKEDVGSFLSIASK